MWLFIDAWTGLAGFHQDNMASITYRCTLGEYMYQTRLKIWSNHDLNTKWTTPPAILPGITIIKLTHQCIIHSLLGLWYSTLAWPNACCHKSIVLDLFYFSFIHCVVCKIVRIRNKSMYLLLICHGVCGKYFISPILGQVVAWKSFWDPPRDPGGY